MSDKDSMRPYISFIKHSTGYSALDNAPGQAVTNAEEILTAAKSDFPSSPWAFLELGKLALHRGNYENALGVYEEMLFNIPKHPEGIIGNLAALLGLGKFEDAKQLFTENIQYLPEGGLNPNKAYELFEIAAATDRFSELNSADFSKLFFLDHLVKAKADTQFLVSIANFFLRILFHNEYIALARKYVTDQGGRFIYVSIDNLFMIKNKSETEKQLLALRTWEADFKRDSWLRNCPPHIENMYSDLPKFSKSYIDNIFSDRMSTVQGTKIVPAPYASSDFNVVKNLRKTTDTPSNFTNTIRILGSSVVYGLGSEDGHTIASFLQRQLLRRDSTRVYKVENHGLHGNPLPACINNLFQQTVSAGDIVILVGYPKIETVPHCLRELETMHIDFSRPHSYGEIFYDYCHMGWKGNEVIARKIARQICSENLKAPLYIKPENINRGLRVAEKSIELIKYLLYKGSSEYCEGVGLSNYIDYIEKHKINITGRVGSVAVNCNPLTAGHLHLLEYASNQVEHLYVFVVEEDLSFFPFKDRIQLVREGTAHLPNVTVLRGGRYICSQFTYPEYYSEEVTPRTAADASMEAWFFCEYIAEALGISIIFLGEEPICQVTKRYNIKMKEILPEYGIEVDIIPRISLAGSVVSASVVRKLLSNNDYKHIREIVPECTYQYLLNNYGNGNKPISSHKQ